MAALTSSLLGGTCGSGSAPWARVGSDATTSCRGGKKLFSRLCAISAVVSLCLPLFSGLVFDLTA